MQIIFFRLTFRSLRERQRGRLALRALKYFWIKSLAKFCQNFQELKFLCHFKNFFQRFNALQNIINLQNDGCRITHTSGIVLLKIFELFFCDISHILRGCLVSEIYS